MTRFKILVTGSDGQLGKELQRVSQAFPQFDFIFLSRKDLPIEDPEKVEGVFQKWHPSYCINCAAYTAVDKAESDRQTAFLVNATSVGNLAAAAAKADCRFIHISTDYVFDGNSAVPLKEDDLPDPINVYGASKLKGEQEATKQNQQSLIIRTSWVYSEFGNNFVKTMMRLMSERESIRVVSDQIGSPTYAADLAAALLTICNAKKFIAGIYHYSNRGKISWYDFAVAIREITGSTCKIEPIVTAQYPTPAKRPFYSLLDKTKIVSAYNLQIPDWKGSLVSCIGKIKKQEN